MAVSSPPVSLRRIGSKADSMRRYIWIKGAWEPRSLPSKLENRSRDSICDRIDQRANKALLGQLLNIAVAEQSAVASGMNSLTVRPRRGGTGSK